jgi:hypothetical protein
MDTSSKTFPTSFRLKRNQNVSILSLMDTSSKTRSGS